VLPSAHSGEVVDVEVQAYDGAGNGGAISSATMTSRVVAWSKDDPGPLPARPRDFDFDPNQGPGPEGDDQQLTLLASTYVETPCSTTNSPCGEYSAGERRLTPCAGGTAIAPTETTVIPTERIARTS